MFFRRILFDKSFKLDDNNLIFKNCIGFNYKNIYDDNYVAQGFTISNDFCIISAYSKSHDSSRIYLYEKNGSFNKFVELDNNAHVGGIAYDYTNNILFVTGSAGKINVYDYNELISGNILKYNVDINISKVIGENTSAATISICDNKLYACTFEGVGKMVVFTLNFLDGKIKVIDNKVIDNLPSAIQGISVFKYNEKLYYLFSQSYGRLKSIIKLYDDNFCFLRQAKLKYIGIEGIDIDYTGNVCCIFENGIDNMKKIHLTNFVFGNNLYKEYKFYLRANYYRKKCSIIK